MMSEETKSVLGGEISFSEMNCKIKIRVLQARKVATNTDDAIATFIGLLKVALGSTIGCLYRATTATTLSALMNLTGLTTEVEEHTIVKVEEFKPDDKKGLDKWWTQ